MPQFIVNNNPDSNGLHEVHNISSGITHCLPNPENRIELGFHPDCYQAIIHAKIKFPSHKFDGCFYCAKTCHTG